MLSFQAEKLLKQRYYLPGESFEGLVKRNVDAIALENKEYFYDVIGKRLFLPNSPSLVNAGQKNGGLMACFTVGPTEDTLENHFEALSDIASVAKKGGGAGFTGTFIRPKDSLVAGSAHGYAYGPNRFAKLVSYAMDGLTQSGFRKMALMYTLSGDHPDAEDFVFLKQTENVRECYNFNQSLMVTNEWMKNALFIEGSKEQKLLHLIAQHAWANGEPGLLFEDTINMSSPYRFSNQYIHTTNPSLRKGTKIPTDLGYLPIELLEGKDFKINNLYGKQSSATCWKSGSNVQLYKLSFKYGGEVYCTPEHKWPIVSENRNVLTTQLRVGDVIPASLVKKPVFGTEGTAEDGYLIGWLYGNGKIRERDGVFTLFPKDDFNNYLGKLSHINIDKPKKFNSRTFNMYMDYFGVGNKQKGLPKFLFNHATEEFCWAFIDGFISTGCNIVNNYAVYQSEHGQLLQDLFEFFGLMGIPCQLSGYGKIFIPGVYFPEEFKLSCPYKFLEVKPISHYYREIEKIEKTNIYDDVWDIRVDDDHHCFALATVITGNCSEEPLPPYGSCNLGSINLNHPLFLRNGLFNFNLLEKLTSKAIEYLDWTGTANKFPTQKHEQWYKNNRPVGLGIMGLADLFLNMGITYGSLNGNMLLANILEIMCISAVETSIDLGYKYGVPSSNEELARRNSTLLSIAPTGSIALIADCSHGIEPIFSPSFKRVDERGQEYLYVHPMAGEQHFVSAVGSKQPSWSEQVDLVAVAQNVVDAGISKTINFPESATVSDVLHAFIHAWKSGCKGITVYRNNSRMIQVLTETEVVNAECKDGVCTL